MLKRFYGESRLTLDALQRMRSKLQDFSQEERYLAVLDEAGIRVRLANISRGVARDVADIVAKRFFLPPRSRHVIGLPPFHLLRCRADIEAVVAPLGREVSDLDDYVAACGEVFTRWRRLGAVAFKDQSAYFRRIDFAPPKRTAAEAIFVRLLTTPSGQILGQEETATLSDWLFHCFLRLAAEWDMPVQIHTGYLTFLRNDVRNANAMHLVPLLEMHRDVRFDLFHANWPYSGEWLFLGKNYPNVRLDFCWLTMMDPIGTRRLFEQALAVVPHGKIHGYGSDLGDCVERAWAHAALARDGLAAALANAIDAGWLDQSEALAVANAWLWDNPMHFFMGRENRQKGANHEENEANSK